MLRTALLLAFLFSGIIRSYSQEATYQYMAYCTDGHGALSPWLDDQSEAREIAKTHEYNTKGHRFEIRERKKPDANALTQKQSAPAAKYITIKSSNGQVLKIKTATGKYQAVCDYTPPPLCSHIGTWFGPERDTYEEAKKDKEDHLKQCPNHLPSVIQW